MTTQLAVEAKGLRKQFGARAAVDGLDLAMPPGQIFGLIGPDGAGKSTTIRMLCGVLEPSGGAGSVMGYDIVAQREQVKARIGYMPQRFSLYSDLTVLENLRLYADLFGVTARERAERVPALLAFSDLTRFQDRRAGLLSGGMKQKLALGCTLIHRPQVLFLDEPTTGVDPVARREFWRILYGLLRDGVSVVVATPYMDEAARCQTIAIMAQGRVLVADDPRALQQRLPETVFELRVASLERARAALYNLEGVTSVQLFGTTLHVVTPTPEAVEPALRQHLAEAGIALDDMRRILPSVEDVYMALTR